MNQMKIGSFMKELRKEKELTQEQIAERFLRFRLCLWNGYLL